MICPACGDETVFRQCPRCKAQALAQRALNRQAGQKKRKADCKPRKTAKAKKAQRSARLQRIIAAARPIIERVERVRAEKDARRIAGMSGILRKTPPPKETSCDFTTKT